MPRKQDKNQPLDKLDANLWELYSAGSLKGDPISVIIRTKSGPLDEVVRLVKELGGSVQRMLPVLNKVVAWVPAGNILELASHQVVDLVGEEGQYTVA